MHCSRFLRMNTGDGLTATSGKGSFFKGTIIEIKKNRVAVEIHEITTQARPNDIHIAIAPTKSIDRFEWFLEKATECGITKITPLITFHSERRKFNHDRSLRIVQSAAKQSLRAWFPKLMPVTTFEKICSDTDITNETSFIAHCQELGLPHLFNTMTAGKPVLLLIGPEGDFSEQEVALARQKNFIEVSLGKNRLRTETAGLTGCQICYLKNELKKSP
ncbi:MAG: RsmE family RNA methyltransferase [Bacteroidota bacterium]